MRTAHRNAARAKHELPKFWRTSLTQDQKSTAQLIHTDLIARFTNGTANAEDMWEWMHVGLTNSQLMRLLEEDGTPFTEEAKAAIAEQLETYPDIMERHIKTGRVGFNGQQLLIARAAAEVMDQLVELDRYGFAVKAARWAVIQLAAIRGAS